VTSNEEREREACEIKISNHKQFPNSNDQNDGNEDFLLQGTHICVTSPDRVRAINFLDFMVWVIGAFLVFGTWNFSHTMVSASLEFFPSISLVAC
jgi:hypothetical protein